MARHGAPRPALDRGSVDAPVSGNHDPATFGRGRVDPHPILGVPRKALGQMANLITLGFEERLQRAGEIG